MLTESQAANILARLAEAQRTIEAQNLAIASLNREVDELEEQNAQLLRKVTSGLFPFGLGPVRLGKRVVSIGQIKNGVAYHVVPVMPIGGAR